jgi:hypothetical protein
MYKSSLVTALKKRYACVANEVRLASIRRLNEQFRIVEDAYAHIEKVVKNKRSCC